MTPVRLAAHYPALPDVAGFAPDYQRDYELETLPYDPHCPSAEDSLSLSLQLQGVWEAQESTVAAEILATTPGTVLDIGAHVGWYSVLAKLFGDHRVIAFEPDPTTRAVLERNAATHDIDITYRPGVAPDTVIEVDDDLVSLVKMDIEGLEAWALAACATLFGTHRIRYALIEVSPIFEVSGFCQTHYIALVGQLRSWGYRGFRVPPKGWAHNDAYRAAPLATMIAHMELGEDWKTTIAECGQDNFVFIRPEDLSAPKE